MTRLSPLSLEFLGEPPWTAPHARVTTQAPAESDVAIVGAGITGMTCAWRLARVGRRVVVFDRRFGHGATSRSGGIIVGDTLVGPAEHFHGCAQDLRAWTVQRRDVDLVWTGCWELERDASLPVSPIDWQDSGPVRCAATIEGGTVDPARLLTSLAAAAVDAGAVIVDGAAIERYEQRGAGVVLSTSAGDHQSARAFVTVDASCESKEFDVWSTRHLTVALETEPVDNDLAAAIGWTSRTPFYTNELPLLWGRATAAGTMIVGRELLPLDIAVRQDARAHIDAAGARLTARLRALHPALASMGIRRVWAGPIARDAAGAPSIVRDPAAPSVAWLGGYGGHGLAQAFRLGTMAASALHGHAIGA